MNSILKFLGNIAIAGLNEFWFVVIRALKVSGLIIGPCFVAAAIMIYGKPYMTEDHLFYLASAVGLLLTAAIYFGFGMKFLGEQSPGQKYIHRLNRARRNR